MTGYGRVQENTSIGVVTVELTSVNHKNLDIHLRLPEICWFMEIEMHRLIKTILRRGHVEGLVKIKWEPEHTSPNIMLNLPTATAYFEEAKRFYRSLGFSKAPEPSWILDRDDVWQSREYPEDNEISKAIIPIFHKAVRRLVNSREEEGKTLTSFFEQKFREITLLLEEVEDLKSKVPALARESLTKRLKELGLDPTLNPDRLYQEIAYTAQRADIAEEVSRLSSHIAAFNNRIHAPETSGRELDFIIQEMNREVNTIGSKSISYKLSSLVIKLKGIINQMREQVQNVE